MGVVAALLPTEVYAGQPESALFRNDFEHRDPGGYGAEMLAADWGDPPWSNGIGEGRTSIVRTEDGGKALEVFYPKGGVGPGGETGGGAQWKMPLDRSYDELYLQYRLWFAPGFDFAWGGKLPGLAGGQANTGGNKPDGTDGWSARIMWNSDGIGGTVRDRRHAQLSQYVYHAGQPGRYAESLRYDDLPTGRWPVIESGRWYTVTTRVRMNTPGEADGVVQSWLDDELVLDARALRFRAVPDFAIDQLLFSTFFGGATPEWAPTRDERVRFDDFLIGTTRPPLPSR